MRFALVVGLLLNACQASVGGNRIGDDDVGVDAPDPVVAVDADTTPACFNGRVVFLSFEGETLTQGPSDARQNLASWMTIASGTAPPYRAADLDRAAQIQAIVDGVRAQLAGFPVTVVTTRPQSGEYVMIVYGGEPAQVGSQFGGAVQELDCNDATARNDVAWISDNVGETQRVVNFSIGAIGFGLGLTATLDSQDCMCGWDNDCNSDNSQPCRLSPNIDRDPNARQLCAGVAKQNELQTFTKAFCE